MVFGVLTTDTDAQAVARAGGAAGELLIDNKGADCAFAAVETVATLRTIGSR